MVNLLVGCVDMVKCKGKMGSRGSENIISDIVVERWTFYRVVRSASNNRSASPSEVLQICKGQCKKILSLWCPC